jgi:hypothetical protein
MSGFLGALRDWLYRKPATPSSPKRDAVELISKLTSGELRRLSDDELNQLIRVLLTTAGHRTALRGNVRFLESVTNGYAKRGSFTFKQRQAVYNILERAYPHNLAAELRNL